MISCLRHAEHSARGLPQALDIQRFPEEIIFLNLLLSRWAAASSTQSPKPKSRESSLISLSPSPRNQLVIKLCQVSLSNSLCLYPLSTATSLVQTLVILLYGLYSLPIFKSCLPLNFSILQLEVSFYNFYLIMSQPASISLVSSVLKFKFKLLGMALTYKPRLSFHAAPTKLDCL